MLSLITDCGDAALLLPAFVLVAIYLWGTGRRRAALAWAAGMVGCIGMTAAFKFGFLVCASNAPAALNIRSPSGHTALGTTFYGGTALLLGAGRYPASRLALGIAAMALVLAIAASRLLLHAHTAPEIAVGLMIGLSGLGIVAVGCFGLPTIGPRWKSLAAALAVLGVLTHGRHLGAEELLARFAQQLRESTSICEKSPIEPVSRGNADSTNSGHWLGFPRERGGRRLSLR